MNRVRVTTGARIHVGFLNLSLAHNRLYGGIGVGLDEPRTVVTAAPADGIDCDHPVARGYVARAADRLGVSGATVTVESALPRHAGLGSGTQLALAVLTAVGRAHGREPDVDPGTGGHADAVHRFRSRARHRWRFRRWQAGPVSEPRYGSGQRLAVNTATSSDSLRAPWTAPRSWRTTPGADTASRSPSRSTTTSPSRT